MFLGWLKNSVGQLKGQERSLIDAIAALPGVLTTLNDEHLLEQATGRQAITWQQEDTVQEALREVAPRHGSNPSPMARATPIWPPFCGSWPSRRASGRPGRAE
ncbi:MAG: hypothetical protein VKO39_06555 [Cyanobacteriota bacterium]|nr:hypothetical protein [Cyanobacteriota bacterium]